MWVGVGWAYLCYSQIKIWQEENMKKVQFQKKKGKVVTGK